MRLQEIQNNWWIPVEDEDWIAWQAFNYERELYELREWWCRPRQITNQLKLALDEPEQPKPINPF